MAGIRETDFTEYELSKIGFKLKDALKADVIDCAGKLEEELSVKTVQKKCGSRILKTRTKGTGDGTLKITVFLPQDLFVDMYGMKRTDLKEGVVAYGLNSQHAVMCITAEVLNEDGEKKLKAYPNCTITTALSRSVDNDSEDVSMIELEVSVMPDDNQEGMYEAVVGDLKDATVSAKWMEEFSRELVETEAA